MDTTDDPIRRAAQALAKNSGYVGDDAWKNFVGPVRLVVKALAGPSVTMIDAGNAAMREAWAVRGEGAPSVAGDAAVSAAWEAMIDRLLGHA